MASICAPHFVDRTTTHYKAVRDYAKKRKEPPAIQAFWSDRYRMWFAIEGSHRLSVCYEIGWVPSIVDVTGKKVSSDLNYIVHPMDLSDSTVLEAIIAESRRNLCVYHYDDCELARGNTRGNKSREKLVTARR